MLVYWKRDVLYLLYRNSKTRENSSKGQFDSGRRTEIQTFQIRSSNVVHLIALIRLASCSFFFSFPNVPLISKLTNILKI